MLKSHKSSTPLVSTHRRFNVCLSLLTFALVLVPFRLTWAGESLAKPERIPLWPGLAPTTLETNGPTDSANAFLTIVRPSHGNGVAAVICPGGGYGGLMVGPEGLGIAEWLNHHGITGLVLEYRLPKGRPFVPLLDAQRALRLARTHAKDWGIDPKKTGIIGFSAGGHLASTAATHFDSGNKKDADPIGRASCRPDFAILIYPVVTMGDKTHGGSKNNLLGAKPSPELIQLFSNEKQVTQKTPPIFMAHAVDDTVVVPDNSRMLAAALDKEKIPNFYLELPNGGHGLSGYHGPSWDAWQSHSLAWLVKIKILPAKALN